MNTPIVSSQLPQALGTYSPGIDLGPMAFFSGQLGLDPQTGHLQEGLEGQLTQIFANIDSLLLAAGRQRKDIVKTTVFLVDLSHFSQVNDHYARYFQAPYPARSCVEVKALPKGALVEIEVITV